MGTSWTFFVHVFLKLVPGHPQGTSVGVVSTRVLGYNLSRTRPLGGTNSQYVYRTNLDFKIHSLHRLF